MISFTLDNQIYVESAIKRAIKDYRRIAVVTANKGKGSIAVSIRSFKIPEEIVRKEFENYLIELMQGEAE